jgi:hypothetical protein
MEAITATTLLNAGADILIMRHPEAIQQVREYIAELGGFEMPKAVKKVSSAAAGEASAPASSNIADSLKEGALCEIVQIMDMPIDLAPGHAIALIKTVESVEDAEGILLSTGVPAAAGESAETVSAEKGKEEKEAFKPETTWTPIEDITTDYKYNLADSKDSAGQKIKLIQDSADPGISSGKNDWRTIIDDDRDAMLQHVKTDLHYWYSEGNGSEKRRTPA